MADGILLIIDDQEGYMDGMMPLPGVAGGDRGAGRFCSKKGPQKAGAADRGCASSVKGRPSTRQSRVTPEIVAPLGPRAGEIIVDKALPKAFAGTDLAQGSWRWSGRGRT